jgi:hypothetical protein
LVNSLQEPLYRLTACQPHILSSCPNGPVVSAECDAVAVGKSNSAE